MYVYVYTYTYMYFCTCIRLYMHMSSQLHVHVQVHVHVSIVFLGTGDMTTARLGIVREVAHPSAPMFASSYLQQFSRVVHVVGGINVVYVT